MFKNPMEMMQALNRLRNQPNPLGVMQAMYGNNPQFQQAMNMAQGKTPEQLQQTAMNLAKTKGVDFQELLKMFQNAGLSV